MNNQYPPDAQPDYYKKFDFGWTEYPPGVTYEDAMNETREQWNARKGIKPTSDAMTRDDVSPTP